MLLSLRRMQAAYPAQFWLLFWGFLISTLGASMIWPFLMVYASERLALPLATVAGLMTVNSIMGLTFSFAAGPIIDRAGRKWVMAVSLLVNGLVYVWMSHASSLLEFSLLMALGGAFNPLYRVGADAMMADLIPAERRADAYSLLRTSNNLGVAVGPAAGGFIATASYTGAFYLAATGMLVYGLLVIFLARETLPQQEGPIVRPAERWGGYGRIWRDRAFMSFIAAFTLTQMSAAILWVLLSVYTKQNFGILERQYGLLPTANALMVVFFQLSITRITKTRPPLLMLSLGSLLYAMGVGTVALGATFWAFLGSMVVFTIGELILSPTATTLAANLAPAEMRGRYMGLYGLTWNVAAGTSPVLGGLLNDHLGPEAIWYGGAAIGLASAVGFLVLQRLSHRPPALVETG